MAQSDEFKILPDQGAKLRYLIFRRGDLRALAPDKKHALGDTVARTGGPSPIVDKQDRLGEALGVDAGTVSRWIGEALAIPALAITEICRIYRVDERAFRELDFKAFAQRCQQQAGEWRGPVAWRDILQEEELPGAGRILLRDPMHKLRHPDVEDVAKVPPLLQVPVETPFWSEFTSPQMRTGISRWAGWHVLLFSHDVTAQSYKCLLPRYQTHPAFATPVFPREGCLVLPHKPVLKHPRDDQGHLFEIVLLVTQVPVPDAINSVLANSSAHGAGLEDILQQLAECIALHRARHQVGVARAGYRVIEPT